MANLTQKLINIFRPFKRIRNEIRKMKSEIQNINADIIARYAYNTMRDLDLVSKDKNLLYLRISDRINICSNFATMKRYLNAVRPVRVSNLVRVGGANDGGYIMINPQIDLPNISESMHESTHDFSPPPRARF